MGLFSLRFLGWQPFACMAERPVCATRVSGSPPDLQPHGLATGSQSFQGPDPLFLHFRHNFWSIFSHQIWCKKLNQKSADPFYEINEIAKNVVQKVEPNMVSILQPHTQLLLRSARDNGGSKQADSTQLSARIGASSFATARNAQQEIELRRQHVSHGGGPRRRNRFQLENRYGKIDPIMGLVWDFF